MIGPLVEVPVLDQPGQCSVEVQGKVLSGAKGIPGVASAETRRSGEQQQTMRHPSEIPNPGKFFELRGRSAWNITTAAATIMNRRRQQKHALRPSQVGRVPRPRNDHPRGQRCCCSTSTGSTTRRSDPPALLGRGDGALPSTVRDILASRHFFARMNSKVVA